MDCFKIKGFSFPLDSVDLLQFIFSTSLKPHFYFCTIRPRLLTHVWQSSISSVKPQGGVGQHISTWDARKDHFNRHVVWWINHAAEKPKGREVPVLRGPRSLSAAPLRLGRPLRHLNEPRIHTHTHSNVATEQKRIRAQLSPRSTIIDHYTICSLLFQPL